jgi:hypothetical protein
MHVMRILVAIEPLAYREVISYVIRELRPHVKIVVADPRNLNREFSRLAPHLVVCSKLTALVEREAPAWVELYPEYGSQAIVRLAGEKSIFDGMDFNTLLSTLDEAERLYESV